MPKISREGGPSIYAEPAAEHGLEPAESDAEMSDEPVQPEGATGNDAGASGPPGVVGGPGMPPADDPE